MKQSKSRIVFMGTPEFAIPSLKMLADKTDIVAVVTQPDRPRARGRKLLPSPIKETALKLDLPVFQPENINTSASREYLNSLQADFFIVVAYGQILRSDILALPSKDILNLHASLLPYYRGGAPIQRALMDGMPQTGVSIMRVERKLDTGAVYAQEEVGISDEMKYSDLEEELANRGAELLWKVIENYSSLEPQPQDHSLATYAALITAEDRLIDWSAKAREVHNKVRGLSPRPAAYTFLRGKRLTITETEIIDEGSVGEIPGAVVALDEQGPIIAAGKGKILLKKIKPEGKSEMSGADFIRGYQLSLTEQLTMEGI